jgi:transposase-like protein
MAQRGGRDGGKERFWRRMVRRWRCSGLSVRAFCAEHGLTEPSFYSWRRSLAERDQQGDQRATASAGTVGNEGAQPQPLFVPLRVVPEAAGRVFEVALGQGRVVRVPAQFDPAALRQLLAVLEEERPC